ncbi:Stk1 family PASTA domain-containing Ser/Thr kinase [Roseburia sp. 499]|uniref:Stk1 family PASTA domain-containing Ser/Thr kinase n=1 Tax=Roseburia sp. 499 TaxID=1261634 RepID=UPI000951636D|nr:Stk1 family PASTA domain-containing Ser/Thr kinase [Roseburia sp. 499]WVK68771.1 Stk1 family PASTA domain-containing Ser/Thr kinase [Roseburia sp. 499]
MLKEGMYLADRYEIVGKVGAGGMSDVYKAKDHTLGRFVAIKVLKQEFSEDVNFVTKFRTEAQSAAGLEHPNIVNIYDVGSENGMYYIVMEYVEGITLKTYIEKKGQLSFKEAVSIAIQVGRGIEAAHNKHIIHRDIKPQNIIISTEGKVKVTDFGIARVATTNTINADVMGSVHYASPEQARNGFVDGKSDIYSLGIVMYEMVTGRVPFDGESTVAIAIQHLQEEMVVPSAYAPNLPISMEKIILKCTQKSPDRRYQTISDLLMDLKKALISPDEDFVVMVPVGQQEKTRVMKPEELESIKEQTGRVYYEEPDEDENEEDDEDDEEEGGFLNPKMEKAVTIMGIVAAVIIVLIVAYIAISLMGGMKFKSNDKDTDKDTDTKKEETADKVEMIDLTGMTFDEAKKALNEIGLGIKKGDSMSSDKYEEGLIVGQSEKDGDMVEKNTTITVNLSSGAGEIEVPSVVGLDKDAATDKLKSAGFNNVKTEYEYSSDVPAGDVIRQTPEGNAKAKKDDAITIYISRGTEQVKMINVLGMTEQQARDALAGINVSVSSVSSDYSDTVPEGSVISQSISEGTFVNPGTSVTLTISLGKKVETYSLNNYKIERLSEIPDNATGVSANITLYKSEGNDKINSWTATSFPFNISQGNIENCSSGYFVVDWSWTVTDESGNVKNETKQTTIEGVNFTKN